MTELTFDQLLEAGCHFGHLKRKWNPKMAPYIFKEHSGIHIIDLQKTIAKANEAAAALKQIARSGKKVLFVATKKQAKEVVSEMAKSVDMPFVTERWPGGMLTNFTTIRKAVKKMNSLDQLMKDKDFNSISKRERLQVERERAKLEKNLGSISDLTRLPSALFLVDIGKEHIALAEARRLNIPTFAMVDTNCNPELVDYAIPANEDASKSIAIIVKFMVEAIAEGLNERKMDKEAQAEDEAAEENEENGSEESNEDEGRRERRDGRPRRPRRNNAPKEDAHKEDAHKEDAAPQQVAEE